MRTRKFLGVSHFPYLRLVEIGPNNLSIILEQTKSKDEFLKKIKNHFTRSRRRQIEYLTRKQSDSPYWYLFRRCMISGTLVKRIISQNAKNESNENLNNSITKLRPSTYKNEAMLYGIANEQTAINVFFNLFKTQHEYPEIKNSGLVIHSEYSYLGASPDSIFVCKCCKEPYLIEVKSPHRLKDTGIQAWPILNDYLNNDGSLKFHHSYYHQIQFYLGLLKLTKCYFVIYAKNEVLFELISFNPDFHQNQINNCQEYYFNHYFPTVAGRTIPRNGVL